MRIVYLTGKGRSIVDLPKAPLRRRDKAVISPAGPETGWTTSKMLFFRVGRITTKCSANMRRESTETGRERKREILALEETISRLTGPCVFGVN